MSLASLEDYDPFDPAVIADPFPYYRLLQRDAPVFEVAKHGIFVLSRYDDVEAAAQNWEDFSTTWGPGPMRVESPVASILQSDPPDRAIAGRVDPRQSQAEFDAYFSAVIEERERDPRDDVISKLMLPNNKGERLTIPEVLSFCLSLLVAGNETTTGLIGNLFFALAQRLDDWRRLRDDPALVATAVEESLRFDAPNQGLFRHTMRDVELHGVTIPAGTKTLLLFGAAGRDRSHFESADDFDIARNPNRHLAFGAGIHHCLGASLGRLEANIALEVASQRIGELELLDERPPYVPVFFIRCPERFRVSVQRRP